MDREVNGMRELWAISHDHWTLPVSVEWSGDIAMIRIGCGVRLLDIQRKALVEQLKHIGQVANNRWCVERLNLERIGRKAEGDPEEVVVWRPFDADIQVRDLPKDPNRAEKLRQRDEFFQEFSREGVVTDPKVAELIWNSFCKFALKWMLVKQRPVDMMFCELHPFPYRPNWMEIMRVELIRKPMFPPPEWLLLRSCLFSWNEQRGFIHWSISIKHNAVWYQTVMEVNALVKKRRRAYDDERIESAKRAIPRAIQLLTNYTDEVTKPYKVSGKYLTPSKMSSWHRPVRPADLVSQSKRKSSHERAERAKVEAVPGVPDLQSKEQPMRERGTVDQPGDWQNGEAGVRVQDEPEDKGKVVKLLGVGGDERNGEGIRVAGGTERQDNNGEEESTET